MAGEIPEEFDCHSNQGGGKSVQEETNRTLETADKDPNADYHNGGHAPKQPLHILLDAGYGLPKESRPRHEKLSAIAKQTINFLAFQAASNDQAPCQVTIVGCPQDMQAALQQRLDNLWQKQQSAESPTKNSLPVPVEFSKPNFSECDDGTEDSLWKDAVYLSPDATEALDPTQPPPSKLVVGLLIDRRVQLNRSLNRAAQLGLSAKRWPLELVDIYTTDNIHSNEPLNVDTILEMVQSWCWNCEEASQRGDEMDGSTYQRALVDATVQALQRHADRHPARPRHRSVDNP